MLALVPGTLFFLFVHLRRKEQVMTVVPAFVLLSSVAIVELRGRLQGMRPRLWGAIAGAIVGLNGLFFLFGPVDMPTARNTLHWNADLAARLSFIRAHFDPETTAVLTHPYYMRLGEVYLRDYRERQLGVRVREEPYTLENDIQTLVLLDNEVYRKPGQDEGFTRHPLSNGSSIRSRTWEPGQQLQVTTRTSALAGDGASD